MNTKQKAIYILTLNGYTEKEAKEELKQTGYNPEEVKKQYQKEINN